MSQLSFEVESPLVFIGICPYCCEAVSCVPVEGAEWGPAEKWSYLGQRLHEKACERFQEAQAAPDLNPLR